MIRSPVSVSRAYYCRVLKLPRPLPLVQRQIATVTTKPSTIRLEQHPTCSLAQPRYLSSSAGNQPVESRTSSDGVVGLPIDFEKAKIEGNESQIVTVVLLNRQVLRAESGAMMVSTDHWILQGQSKAQSLTLFPFLTQCST